MKGFLKLLMLTVSFAGISAGAYVAGQKNLGLPMLNAALASVQTHTPMRAAPSGAVLYYRDPSGKAAYSLLPKKSDDGHDYVAVLASEDMSFAPKSKTASQPETPVDPAMAAAQPAKSGERKILYYRNPMGLADTSKEPKKDSMGMDYLPVYDGEVDEGKSVKVAGGKLQRTGVKTTLATKTAIVRPVNIPGSVMLDERRISVVSTRTEAFVEQVADITTGSTIQKGQPLVRFFAKEIAAAGALYAADIKTGGKGAGSKGSLQRLTNLGVPLDAIKAIEDTGKVPISVTLLSPRSGVVLERMAVDGMMAAPGATLFRIADASEVWVVADVPEYELSSIAKGAEAIVHIRSLPDLEFKGKVELISPEIQSQTRTAKVRIELPNPDGLLLANMYAEVEIKTGSNAPVVTVPDSAVIDTGERQIVIVDKGDGSFEPRDVKPGLRGEGMVEIKQGITEGERVVTAANFLIDAESNLKAALSALSTTEVQP